MARPEEMAQNMMNKWVKMREDQNATRPALAGQKRPFLASQCEFLHDAEYWRRQIVREITKNISSIQNPGLGEHKIRDLNDEINKRFRELHHWNKRIKELGGPDYIALEKKRRIVDPNEAIEGSGGYRYFGAAKDLPGVKELFAKQAAKVAKRKQRHNQYPSTLTPDYYGWRDEEDGVLLEVEQQATEENEAALEEAREEYKRQRPNDEPAEENQIDLASTLCAAQAMASDPSSAQKLLQEVLLERKKKDLLERLA